MPNDIQSVPSHVIELPSRARALFANPSLSFSTSKIPRKEVKNAPPKIIVCSLRFARAI